MAKKIHISEDEQLEKVKTWWKSNGTGIISGIVLGLGLIVGYNWWQNRQDDRALQASDYFSQLVASSEVDESEKTVELATILKNDYSATDYAAKGLIIAAITQIKSGDHDAAKSSLKWVIDNSKLIDNKQLATYRLARQFYREGDYDAALKLVNMPDKGGFASQYFELIGDIHNKQLNLSDANKAYQQAMETMSGSAAGYREILQLKIDNTAT